MLADILKVLWELVMFGPWQGWFDIWGMPFGGLFYYGLFPSLLWCNGNILVDWSFIQKCASGLGAPVWILGCSDGRLCSEESGMEMKITMIISGVLLVGVLLRNLRCRKGVAVRQEDISSEIWERGLPQSGEQVSCEVLKPSGPVSEVKIYIFPPCP